MKIPCEDCIVDMICIEKCEKLVEFIEHIDTKDKKVPENLVTNSNRYLRVSKACDWSKMSYKLYVHLSLYLRMYLKTRGIT